MQRLDRGQACVKVAWVHRQYPIPCFLWEVDFLHKCRSKSLKRGIQRCPLYWRLDSLLMPKMRFPDDGDLNNLHVDHPFIVGIAAGRVSPFDLEWMNVLITGGFVRDHRQGRNCKRSVVALRYEGRIARCNANLDCSTWDLVLSQIDHFIASYNRKITKPLLYTTMARHKHPSPPGNFQDL